MRETNVEIKKGNDLSVQLMKEINKIFQKAFPGNEPVNIKNQKLFSKDIFFIVRDSKQKLLSIGRLRPVRIVFLKKVYNIQGIADIVSVIERKGHGRVLMSLIYEHLISNKQTGIGFCNRKNSPFYHKCGFKITKNLEERFLYKNPKGKIIKNKGGEHLVLYLTGKDKFIEKVLANPKEKVLIPCPHW